MRHKKQSLLAKTGTWAFRITTRSLCAWERAHGHPHQGALLPSCASPGPVCGRAPNPPLHAGRPPAAAADVAVVCFVAIALPFFNDFVGLIGALGFWPGEPCGFGLSGMCAATQAATKQVQSAVAPCLEAT